MSDEQGDYVRSEFATEVRDTVFKSSLTGVAATVLAVTIFSPAGLGGMIGTSLASGAGVGPTNAAADPYANLPPFPAPLTADEISDIRGQLAATAASLEITRAATEAKIEQMRQIAMTGDLVTFTPAEPVALRPQMAFAPEPEPQPAEVAESEPVQSGYRDSHLELAALLLDRETF